jgi:hypothetical protein
MSLYHGQARLMKGQRDELRTHETDNLADAKQWARELASEGFTIWIYDHGNTAVAPGGSDYRTILTFTPDGQSVEPR